MRSIFLHLCGVGNLISIGDQRPKNYGKSQTDAVNLSIANCSHSLRADSILATTEAKQKGFDEALLLDMNGYVAEGPGANFFFEKDEKLFTAPLGNILAGITRQTVFELADELGIEVVEKHFTPEDVYDADGAFFTGTAAEVAGIESLDGNTFGLPWEETLGAVLSTAYLNRVQKLEYKNFELV